ncbi:hypothetical protein BPLS_P6149 [Bathymodiolus platifrons methanotrophic gill symbiont]|uniref:DUF2442 domain-containing protein n=1 Tax=Bathymodiolus platifrons methanotrophic gill symbiont TaxID=113268 RepID=UPI0011CBF16A|nr:DUF2442 domain-containing protein [Bathymodiolus platifrons methanotrophic gill symbiont]TXK93671.1 hypothetical protein BMR02_14885 [Methylococcaceae bacterium HT1]TXL13197.1 hypothetical protein BMR05_12570 [Methylococcaceae bacterium HT4]TXL14145.1 hypothetical protein BMR06_16525 [Methylococcaceae bacterium HT5]TXL14284.1 hypothetical protein BMR04_13520 [Methylococcaceae bacterium HT3]TXL23865.1 hypothetical protein BMR03_00610 [Methylococcaceae bacterium HT2]
MFLHVTSAKYLEDYKVQVSFNNGREGVADLSSALKGKIFEPLKNKSEFSNLVVDKELDTIVWSNGADLAPEFIFFQAFKDEPELQHQFIEWGYVTQNSLTNKVRL